MLMYNYTNILKDKSNIHPTFERKGFLWGAREVVSPQFILL
jgi:hypothetical protein